VAFVFNELSFQEALHYAKVLLQRGIKAGFCVKSAVIAGK